MTRYIVLDICGFNLKKKEEYKKLINKEFEMDDRLIIGQQIQLKFEKETIKSKLESIKKEKEMNVEKHFILTTSAFTAVIIPKEFYNSNDNREQ